ncbi:MAG: hypothetical protein LLF90_09180 [Methanomicrobiaceae archaeon]|uniref:hypothetical protein n=1 Tax=Methanoculleus sp. TaxID=90427 RepID=UPI00320E7E06|nr:hypothetical protein [Methanomicrobiaceae archaeon]
MKTRTYFTVILLLALITGAMAAEGIPEFPEEYSGTITIDGKPAPAGTTIVALIDGEVRGTLTTTEAGKFGGSSTYDAKFTVTGYAGDTGKTITFTVNGKPVPMTATFGSKSETSPGKIHELNLAAKSEGGSTGSGGSSTGSGGGGSKDPGSQLTYDPGAPRAPEMHIGRAPLTISTTGVLLESVTVRTTDETSAVTVQEGTTARDRDGNPLGEVTCTKVAPAEVPPASPGTTVAIVLSCGPAGATFDPPATLTYTLSGEEWARIDDGATLSVMWYNPETEKWQDVPATVDPATRTVTAEVSHFSIYALAWTITEAATTPAVQETGTGGQEPAPVFPTWALALVVVLIAALVAFLVMRRK